MEKLGKKLVQNIMGKFKALKNSLGKIQIFMNKMIKMITKLKCQVSIVKIYNNNSQA